MPHGPADMPPPAMRHVRNELRMVIRGETRTHRFLRTSLTVLALATLLIDLAATLVIYLLEHNEPDSDFDDFGGALFWVSAQLTTVSSQMRNPVTGPGQVLDILLELWAISVVATLAASLTTFFHVRHTDPAGVRGGSEDELRG